MNLRAGTIGVSLASVMLAACASSGTMQAARDARYQGDRSAMLETVVETVQAGYEVVNLNPETGLIVTRDRWYEKDGTFEDKKANEVGIIVEDGSILLRYEVHLLTAGPEYRVEVTPVIAQFRNGYAAPFKLKPDSLEVPGWIHGKTEKLTVAIYDALARYRVGAPGAGQ
ncbi:MAG: hypothetical protein F9K40_20890 [Kofleriaceae bacterium]|nr:MAG: hypothetical protein F9K40_20890 [Kofleriaceae bacterium]